MGTNASNSAGPFGEFNCDLAPDTLTAWVAALQKLTPRPDFVLWTGDDSPDNLWAQSRGIILDAAKAVTAAVKEAFGSVPVFPALGNHESFPIDQYEGPPYDSWLYDGLADMWTGMIDADAIQQFRYAGYYTTLIGDKFRVISLNTMYCEHLDFWLVLPNTSDLGGQLVWTAGVLASARANGERVLIIGHIPFGSGSCIPSYGKKMYDLVSNYSDIITGMFFGHTHHDQFEVVRDVATDSTPVNVMWISPSVTPQTDVYPTFRVYLYNRTTKEILDVQQYTANITQGNIDGTLEFKLSYTMRAEYDLNGLAPGDMQNFIARMGNDDALFSKYLLNVYSGHAFRDSTVCDASCRRGVLCGCASGDGYLVRSCMNNETLHRDTVLKEMMTC